MKPIQFTTDELTSLIALLSYAIRNKIDDDSPSLWTARAKVYAALTEAIESEAGNE